MEEMCGEGHAALWAERGKEEIPGGQCRMPPGSEL